ncbi:hypothetical protein C1645_819623 [Glomus cerebriforme]|uniref:Uncharacterized protein n=1 Tax=Glomus cerebriforme TaxID=658196 RepID=A0A397TEJ0_9GLOM|nr:hypothetical protein C1645_819623 [Glomus cerebriforme]
MDHNNIEHEIINNNDGFNDYSDDLQPSVNIDDVNSHCDCANCYSTFESAPTTVPDQSSIDQISSPQYSHSMQQYITSPQDVGNVINGHVTPRTQQYSSSTAPQDIGSANNGRSASLQYNKTVNEYSPTYNNQNPLSNFSSQDDDLHVNSPKTSYELLKIEVSGFEITVRQKFPPDLNQKSRQNEQSNNNHDRRTRRHHPYHVPNCRHNVINNRDDHVVINSSPQQSRHSRSLSCSALHYRTSAGRGSLNAQNAHVDQSGITDNSRFNQ